MMNNNWSKRILATNRLSTLLNQLSPEQQKQVRNANYWQIDQLEGLQRIEYQIKVLQEYIKVLNKRPEI